MQKSKEKNVGLEEQHRRNEAAIRRKQAQAGPLSPSVTSDDGAPKSPASTGAMDDLLQKLRAAKPEARDQRDRRRRARLKDRHQVRVASGQQIPEIGVNMADEGEAVEEGETAEKANLLSPTSETNESETSIGAITSPTAPSADVADRAAAMLQGLQGPDGLNKDGSLSVRRRRESADNERERRRRRRQQATSKASEDGGLMSPSIPEERELDGVSDAGGSVAGDHEERPVTRGSDEQPNTPTTVVVPPSPEQKSRELPTPPPDEA